MTATRPRVVRTARPRVLVVDEALPFPADSGKRIRTSALLTRLAAEFDITLAYHEEGATIPEGIEAARAAGLSLEPVPRRALRKKGVRFAFDLARNVVLPVPYMVMGHRTRALGGTIADALAGPTPPDLVHVEWTPLVANVPRDCPVPVAIAAHNVETDIWRRYHENEKRLAHRAYIGLQRRKVERFERRALRAADLVTAVSEHDGARIRTWTGQPHVVVVPNGVDATYFAPRPEAAVDRDEIVFVGALDWRPNQDGVTWFLDEVLPRVRAARPTTRLAVVGRAPPEALRARWQAHAGVTVHGSVPDVRPFMARGAVFVVPLRIGGGSRLKICEALAMQRPVVSTTVGAEGLDLGDGLLRADEPEALAAALCHTLEASAEGGAMARRGRARVLSTYEWDVIAPQQARAWKQAIASGAKGRDA